MEPTTQEALDLINAKIQNCVEEITNHQAQINNQTKLKAGYQLQADLLQNKIDTPSNDLVAKTQELADKESQRLSELANKESTITTKQAELDKKLAYIGSLKAQVTNLGGTPVIEK